MTTMLLLLLAVIPGTSAPAAKPARGTGSEKDAWDLRWVVGPSAGQPTMPPPRQTPRLRALGATLYANRCAGCHGENGDGKGPRAPQLGVPPTNFGKGVYKLRSTPAGSIPTDEDLFRTLSRGVHGTPMLPWTNLSERERWALVYQLESFSVRFREERRGPVIEVPPAPREDDALREKGRALYGLLRCANCHGELGAADGPAAQAYGRGAPADAPRIRDFTRGRFIRGTEMEDIYLTLRGGLEGTPMASYDALSDDQIWALAAWVRALIRERPVWDFPPARTGASSTR
jgi:mono/diheme cytochrome c family protein